MELPRVNYLIAACSARTVLADTQGIASRDMLRLHLQELAKTNTQDLAQVTILRALPLHRARTKDDDYYWDVEPLFGALSCPVAVVDVNDRLFSYSSWIYAAQKYRDTFDYYVLIEDDYYPAHKEFVKVLIDIHKDKLPDGGYLNSFTVGTIAAVSNGFCDSASFIKGIDSAAPDPITAISSGAQVLFGPVLFGKNMTDYTDQYRTLFHSNDIVEETHDISRGFKQDIFNPIQYLGTGEQEFVKCVAHG